METTWRMRGRLRGADEARFGFKTADERGPLDPKRIERPRLNALGFFLLASTAAGGYGGARWIPTGDLVGARLAERN